MNTAPECGDSSASKSELLAVFSGSATSARAMYDRALPRLRRLARRHAPSLPRDLHDEIVQETWLLVIGRGVETFLAARVTGDVYLAMVLRNAAEAVKSNNRPPGAPSRANPAQTFAVMADFCDAVENGASMAQFESEHIETQIRLDVARFAATLERPAARALQMMLDDGLTMTDAAAGVGMSRPTLSRRLTPLRKAA